MQRDLIVSLKNNIYSITIASFITILIITLASIYNSNSLVALIVSYGAIVCSLILMFGILYNKVDNILPIFDKIISLFPFIIIISISLFIIYLLVSYFEQIANNRVSDYYYSFSLLSTIFLITQISILFNNIGFETSKYISNKTFSILTLLGTINFIIVLTLGIILKFYSTDG
jgi:hypothetical protein